MHRPLIILAGFLLPVLSACAFGDGESNGGIGSASSSASSVQMNNSVRNLSVQPMSTITSPLVVTGEARGTWYFEASFPIRILDANNSELGVGIAQAQADWMTTDFVPFQASITFTPSTTATGTLVIEKDNPSGLPQNAGSIHIPVQF